MIKFHTMRLYHCLSLFLSLFLIDTIICLNHQIILSGPPYHVSLSTIFYGYQLFSLLFQKRKKTR